MKKILLFLIPCLTLLWYSGWGQDDPEQQRRMEIKANAFNLIVFKSAEASFEYLIDSESSFGATMLFNLDDVEDSEFEDAPYYRERFAFTPYYRRFFSRKYAWGFFMEAFSMFNIQKDYDGYWDDALQDYRYFSGTSNNLAFGIALGGKFVSNKGFVFEFYGGPGRNIIESDANIASEFVPRVGVSFGYRF